MLVSKTVFQFVEKTKDGKLVMSNENYKKLGEAFQPGEIAKANETYNGIMKFRKK